MTSEPVRFGRIAFACPGERLEQLQADVIAAGYKVSLPWMHSLLHDELTTSWSQVHTPYVSLDTPGKATVQVVILQDPDGHEICFVGDVGFRDLSQVDPEAPRLLAVAMEQDKSDEWEAKMQKRRAFMTEKGV